MADSPDLKGRRILVTGSSTGIGEAIAQQALDAGAHVAGLARSVSDGFAKGIHNFRCDVRDEEQVERAIDRAAEALGGHLDGIVANAGYGLYGHITKGNPKDWYDVVQTNVLGLLYTVYLPPNYVALGVSFMAVSCCVKPSSTFLPYSSS